MHLGAYRYAEAARVAQTNHQTIVAWLKLVRTDESLAESDTVAGSKVLSYPQLLELALVARCRRSGVHLSDLARLHRALARRAVLRGPYAPELRHPFVLPSFERPLAPRPAQPLDAATLRDLEDAALPQLTEGVALGQAHGFHFGLEHNEPGIPCFGTPERCAAALAAVPGLGFVWDFNHTTPEQLPGYLALTDRMTMQHVADTPLPAVNHHLPLGLGTIDFAAYCRALLARGFHGPAILEIGDLPLSGGYGRDTDAALVASRVRFAEVLRTEA